MSDITVVMNGYKRGQNLSQQLGAIKLQSVKPQQIMLWYNHPGDEQHNKIVIENTTSAVSNKNFGVWARFAYALNAKTKYVCVFDDDTIPGSNWLKNCQQTIKQHRGLLGTIGLIYNSKQTYFDHSRYGWDNNNEQTVKVDIIGHSWFFERQFLTAFWRQLPPAQMNLCGQDIHFSYTLQKYFGLSTYVPPHPKNDKTMWGSTHGWELGVDKHAISLLHINTGQQRPFRQDVQTYYKRCLNNGWKLVKHA